MHNNELAPEWYRCAIYTVSKAKITHSKNEVAERAGMKPSALSRIISGEQNLTLATIAKLECALGVRFDAGFRYETEWKGLSYSKPQEQVESDRFSDDADERFSSRRMDENLEASANQAVEWNASAMGVAA